MSPFCSPFSKATRRVMGTTSRVGGRGLLAVALLALVLAGCGEEEGDELKGPLGPGEGGPAITQANIETHDFPDPDGISIGEFDFDNAVLITHIHPDDSSQPSLHVLSTIAEPVLLLDLADGELDDLGAEDIVIAFTRIVGRPDTPCRVQAALLARDEGYDILGSGDRRNDQALEFHQVNLRNRKIPRFQRFYCAELAGDLGILANVVTRGESVQSYLQVHYVLNSIRDL